MKFKHIVIACVAVCGGSAFAAATPVSCKTDSALNLVNTCAPEVTFMVGGASAQQGALETVLKGGTILDPAAVGARITVSGASMGLANGNNIGYYGIGAAGTTYAGKRVAVLYNKANGSAAGVSELLTGKGTKLSIGGAAAVDQLEASAWVKLPLASELAKGIAGVCSGGTAAVAGTSWSEVSCSNTATFSKGMGADLQKKLHMALSDVRPSELSPGVIQKWDTVKFPAEVTGMEGFGVIVNAPLYAALIAQNIADGLLPSSCQSEADAVAANGAVESVTGACQPNLKRADYASVIGGKVATGNEWFGSTIGGGKTLKLFRRVNSSGTQASSNIFFAGQPGYIAKTPLADGFIELVNASFTRGGMAVTEGVATGDVLGGVSGEATNFALGVVSLENSFAQVKTSGKLKGAGYVKLDGISPNFANDGTLDSKARVGMLTGYPFAMEMVAVKPSTLAGDYLDIYNKIVTGLKDPSVNLPGIGYIGSSDATKNTAFTHNGNNYLPLSK